MHPYIIVGGGISGLLAAHALKKRGVSFIGFEKEDALGGRTQPGGHHRWYHESSIFYLQTLVEGVSFEKIEEVAKQRKKGAWTELEDSLPDDESFYVATPFFRTEHPLKQLIEQLAVPIQEQFQLRKEVTEILPEQKEIVCQDGTRFQYEKIVWCSPLELLNKVWKGDRLELFRLMKKAEPVRGGIQLDLETNKPIFDCRNTVVFPFKFKENRLRALGTGRMLSGANDEMSSVTHWLLFLDPEISEDREELAKCIRAFRRELDKDFPEIKTELRQERIIFLSSISGEVPLASKTVEILPELIYVGPELSIGKGAEDTRNLDRIVDNTRHLEESLEATKNP
jgi:hypothetical protein